MPSFLRPRTRTMPSDPLLKLPATVRASGPDLGLNSYPSMAGAVSTDLSPQLSLTSAANTGSDLKLAFQLLGGVPDARISVATGALVSIITDGIENTAASNANSMASRKLTKTIGKLWFLVSSVHNVRCVSEESREAVDQLVKTLRDLAAAMDAATKNNTIRTFFNSDDGNSAFDSHDDNLRDCISRLTACLADATNRDTKQIRQDAEEALKQLRTETEHLQSNKMAGKMEVRMSNNEIQTVSGAFESNNEVSGGASMYRDYHGNKIGSIGGDAFSGNRVTQGLTRR